MVKPYEEPDLDWHEWHPTFSVTLGSLVEDGWVNWQQDGLFWWGDAAHDDETYKRLCEGIEARYWYREISMIPPGQWRRKLLYVIRFELCPKYNRLYDIIDDVNILQDSDKYGKRREIGSDFPETLLSDNANYVSTGEDSEYEDIELGRALDAVPEFIRDWTDVDQAFLDGLERMFSAVITFNVNI